MKIDLCQISFLVSLVRLWNKQYFGLCKSCSNPFLEPTSTKQLEQSFLIMETMGAFDGDRTHDWQVSTDHESDALHTAPRHLCC